MTAERTSVGAAAAAPWLGGSARGQQPAHHAWPLWEQTTPQHFQRGAAATAAAAAAHVHNPSSSAFLLPLPTPPAHMSKMSSSTACMAFTLINLLRLWLLTMNEYTARNSRNLQQATDTYTEDDGEHHAGGWGSSSTPRLCCYRRLYIHTTSSGAGWCWLCAAACCCMHDATTCTAAPHAVTAAAECWRRVREQETYGANGMPLYSSARGAKGAMARATNG